MRETQRSIDDIPSWMSKILLNRRKWPLYKTNINTDLKSMASDYLPEYPTEDS